MKFFIEKKPKHIPKILAVFADEKLREKYTGFLERACIKFNMCAAAEVALQSYTTDPFDLILFEHPLQHNRDLVACMKIRLSTFDNDLCRTPIVLINKSKKETDFSACGVDACISDEDFDFNQLKQILSRVCSKDSKCFEAQDGEHKKTFFKQGVRV